MPDDNAPPSSRTANILRHLIRLGCFVLLVWLLHWGGVALQERLTGASRETQIMISAGLLVSYALLIAIPFVPGVEIGLSLMLLNGAEAAPGVYIATVIGLSIAYAIGSFIPFRWIEKALREIGLKRFANTLSEFQSHPLDQRLTVLQDRLPDWLGWITGHFRYVMLAALINMPGSSVIGGGGGILMMAGLSRLFRGYFAVLTILLAVLPVPLLVWLYGGSVLSGFAGN